jgi:predicted transcriptional regulator
MYGANLSYSTLRKYLVAMSSRGLISKTGSSGSNVYRTTQEGRALLRDLQNVKGYLTINTAT